MMKVAVMSRRCLGSVLGFLMLTGAACESRQLSPSPDARSTSHPDARIPNCANVGCAAPPVCSVGCQAGCGCCPCAPGERNGDLVCTDQGCYAPAPAGDAGRDGGGDVGSDVCWLPFEAGPCEAAIPVFAFVGGVCVPRTYGGCEGNGNRFSSYEECTATCVNTCPPGRVSRRICLGCGPAGGCSMMGTICALVCDPDAGASACEPSLPVCYQGVCQVATCI